MKNKIILIFTDWYLPGFKAGGPIRSIANLVALLERDCKLYIVTSDRDFQGTLPYADITPNTWLDHTQYTKVYYTSPNQMSLVLIKKLISDIKPHTIYLNSMWSISFTFYPLFWGTVLNSHKIILAPRGMLQGGAIHIKANKKKLFVYFLRASGILKHMCFHATDNQEAKDIAQYFTKNKVIILPNIPVSICDKVNLISKNENELKLLFVSRISPKKNLHYLLQVLSKISMRTKVHLTIVGPQEDEKYFQKCQSLADLLPINCSASFVGALQHNDVIQKIIENHFFILPTLGENFGHAIFEAFSAGRPAIISDQTPWKDLESQKIGFDLPLNDAQRWVNIIEYVAAMDQDTFDLWCSNAHKYAQKIIDINSLRQQYLSLFSNA